MRNRRQCERNICARSCEAENSWSVATRSIPTIFLFLKTITYIQTATRFIQTPYRSEAFLRFWVVCIEFLRRSWGGEGTKPNIVYLCNCALHLCCTAHKKKSHFADFLHKSTTGSTSTCVFFLYDIPSLWLLCFLFFRVRAAKKQACGAIWYIRDVVFVVSWGSLLRPTAGAAVLIPKCTTLQNGHWLCASKQEESYAISLWSSTATSAVSIA